MQKEAISQVEDSIGYTFKNHELLRQAFTRRSYAQENGGEDNEILEFIGDKALDLAVVQLLVREFGRMKDRPNVFQCSLDEGKLSSLKSRMVEKRYLARRIEELDFGKFLIMGVGDKQNNVGSEPSVREDLFEAILGAVTLDCSWDFEVICSVVEAMLCTDDFFLNDTDDNYVRLIQEWEEKNNHTIPLFWFKERKNSAPDFFYYATIPEIGYGYIAQTPPSYGESVNYYCDLKLLDVLPVFRGWGASKSEARMNVCKLGYDYLFREGIIEEPSIRNEIGEPTAEFAINQLEILARRGYFPLPEYDFSQEYDTDGNPIWQCTCSVDEYTPQSGGKCSSKKGAKKSAALKMLHRILKETEDSGALGG